MSSTDEIITRRADGSIDLQYYARRSALLHRQAMTGHRAWLAAYAEAWLLALRAALTAAIAGHRGRVKILAVPRHSR